MEVIVVEVVIEVIGIVMFALKVAVKTLLLPFILLARFFGFASDEGSALAAILQGVGFAIGTILTGLLLVKGFSLMINALRGIGLGFINLQAKIKNTGIRLNTLNHKIKGHNSFVSQNNGLQHQHIDLTRRAGLQYRALTGKLGKTKEAIRQVTIEQDKLNAKNKKFTSGTYGTSEAFSKTNKAALGLGGAALVVGSVLTEVAGESLGGFASGLITLGSLVVTIVPLITSLFGFLATATWSSLWPILAIVAAVGAAYALYKYFADTPENPNVPKPKSNITAQEMTGRTKVSNAEVDSMFSDRTALLSPDNSNMVGNSAVVQTLGGGGRKVIERQHTGDVYNINKIVATNATADGVIKEIKTRSNALSGTNR